MKKILFLATAVVVTIIGCGSCEDGTIPPEMFLVSWEQQSPYDSSIKVAGAHDVVYFFKDDKIQKTIYSQEKIVNSGYGEIDTTNYVIRSCFFLKDGIVLPWEDKNAFWENDNQKVIDFYSNEFDSIATVLIDCINISILGDNILFTQNFSYAEGKSVYVIKEYDANGKEIFQKQYDQPTASLPYSYKNMMISYEEYINIGEDDIRRIHLGNGTVWNLKYNSLIPNKPSNETNPPRCTLEKHELNHDIISLVFNVTYYSGEKETVTIRINSQGEMV